MSGKNLTFKLVMEGDNKGLVASAKQSQEVVSKVFETIKQEANALRDTTDKASEGLKSLVTPETTKLAKALTDNLGNATSIIKGAGTQAQSTAKNFTEFGKKSEQALGLLISDLGEAKKKLEAFSKTNASPAQIQAAQTEVDNLEKQVTEAGAAFYDFNQIVGKANTKLKETDSAAQTAQKGLNSAKFAATALVGAMATLGIGLGIRELAQTADTYTNLSARINIATREGGDFTSAMAGVHQVALMTNSSLDATGSLFTRLNTVGKEMGMTQQQALNLTKTVTQAIQIGGGSAQASEAAITQFIQAMQGGVLRGEEFNSIMENGYGVAEALARGLGVTTGELRKMAENGELSAERVVKALQSQASEVQKTYDQFPTTIGNALQRISTSWEVMIGKMDQSNGASATVAEWLVTIADNIRVVETLLNDMGDGFVWVGDQLKKVDTATIEAIKSALIGAYETVKSLGSNVAILGETIWSAFNSALDAVSPLFAALFSGTEEVSGLQTVLNLLQMAMAAVSDTATGFNVGLKLLLSGIQFLSGGMYALSSQVLGFIGFEALADQAQKASDRMFAQAEKNASGAIELAQNHKWAVIETYNEIGKTQEQKDAESVASSKAKLDDLLAHQQTEADSKKVTEDEKLKAVQAYAEASITANKGVMDGVMQADLMTKGYIVTMDQAGKVSVEAWQKNSQVVDESALKLENARKGAVALGVDLDNALNKTSEKFNASKVHLDGFANGLKELGLEGEQATNALYLGWEKWLLTAKNQAEIDAAKAKLQLFGEQGKLSTSQVEMGLQAVKRATLELPDSISPVEAAFERLGIKTKEQLKLAADLALNDLETIMKSGEATQEGLQKAYEETIRLAYASGDAQVMAAANAKAAYLGLEVQVDKAGKATVATLGQIQEARQAVQQSVQQVSKTESTSSLNNNPQEEDYWTAFKAKQKAKVDERNALNSAQRINPTSTNVASEINNPVVAELAPLITTAFSTQATENIQPKETKRLELAVGDQTAELEGTPQNVDLVDQLLSKLERDQKRR